MKPSTRERVRSRGWRRKIRKAPRYSTAWTSTSTPKKGGVSWPWTSACCASSRNQPTRSADPCGRLCAHRLVRHLARDVDIEVVQDRRCNVGQLDERSSPRRPTPQHSPFVAWPLNQRDVQLGTLVGQVGDPEHHHQRPGWPHPIDGPDDLVEARELAQSTFWRRLVFADDEQRTLEEPLPGECDRLRRPVVDPAFPVGSPEPTPGPRRSRAPTVDAQGVTQSLTEQSGNRVEGKLVVVGHDGIPSVHPGAAVLVWRHLWNRLAGVVDGLVQSRVARPVAGAQLHPAIGRAGA